MAQLGGVASSVLNDGVYVAEEVAGRFMPDRTDDAAICDPHSGIFNVSEIDILQTARTSKPTSLDSVLFQEILEAVFPIFLSIVRVSSCCDAASNVLGTLAGVT